jgi:hypothetical protein
MSWIPALLLRHARESLYPCVFPGKFRERLGAGVTAALSKNGGSPFQLVVAGRTKHDEVSQVEGFAAGRDGLDVVNLEPTARAATGAAVAVAAERGCACELPSRRGADEHTGFACGAALP